LQTALKNPSYHFDFSNMDILKNNKLDIKNICRNEEYFFHVGNFKSRLVRAYYSFVTPSNSERM